jgi:hypothetical protein
VSYLSEIMQNRAALWLHLAWCLVLTAVCWCLVCVMQWLQLTTGTGHHSTNYCIASRVLVHNLIVSHLFTFQFLITANLSTYSNSPFLWPIVSQINPLLSYLTLNIILPDRNISVSMATSYVLKGPGIQFRWGWNFSNRARPVFGPTQPPIKWALGPFPRGEGTGEWH